MKDETGKYLDQHLAHLTNPRTQTLKERTMSRKQFHKCEQCQEPTNKRRTRNADGLLVCHFCKDKSTTPPIDWSDVPSSPVEAPSSLSKALAKGNGDNSPSGHHAVVRAYAGTGKTFSEIMGVAWAYAQDRWADIQRGLAQQLVKKGKLFPIEVDAFTITPSDEQQAIWDHFASIPNVKSIIYCAFNKSIVQEFDQEWGWLVEILKEEGVTLEFRTVNSLGSRALFKAYGRLGVNGNRVEGLVAAQLGQDIWELRKRRPTLLKAVSNLVDLCKLNLTNYNVEGYFYADGWNEELDKLTAHYDIELNGERNAVYDLVPKILEECLRLEHYREIDFNDQNWLPVVLDLPITKVDLALVDEGQDLPRCKQEFVMKLARNICLVGDVNQAIYGFAGADVDSIPHMEKMLGVTEPLTLSETRRCSKAVVAEAQKLVPDFKAHESNSEGRVTIGSIEDTQRGDIKIPSYRTRVEDGDMCLCRCNGPLVSEALRFIKDGRKALIRGRQFGQSLANFVTKMKATDAGDLINKVSDWHEMESQKENKKKFPSEAKLMNLEDRKDCIISFAEGVATTEEVLEKINLVFAGKQCPKCKKHFNEETDRCPCKECKTEPDPSGGNWKVGPKLVTPAGIIFSSIHKAKGLESSRVFLLQPKEAPIPHPMAKSSWARGQEMNLLYVAITRAIEELVFVS